MNAIQNSFLAIENAHTYWCQMYGYVVGHSELCIQTFLGQETFYLNFISVKYFAGPHIWKSANFQIAPVEDCLGFVRSVEVLDELPNQMIQEKIIRLYIIKRPRLEVKIVAGEVFKSFTTPSYYG